MIARKFSLQLALRLTKVLTFAVVLIDLYVCARLAVVYSEGGIPALKAYIRPDRLVGTVDPSGVGHFVVRASQHPYVGFALTVLVLTLLTFASFRTWKMLARKVRKT